MRMIAATLAEHCESQSIELMCSDRKSIIVIEKAMYGILAASSCYGIKLLIDVCADDVTNEVIRECSGNVTCNFDVNSLLEDSICANAVAYLVVDYVCIEGMQY